MVDWFTPERVDIIVKMGVPSLITAVLSSFVTYLKVRKEMMIQVDKAKSSILVQVGDQAMKYASQLQKDNKEAKEELKEALLSERSTFEKYHNAQLEIVQLKEDLDDCKGALRQSKE